MSTIPSVWGINGACEVVVAGTVIPGGTVISEWKCSVTSNQVGKDEARMIGNAVVQRVLSLLAKETHCLPFFDRLVDSFICA